MINNYKNLKRAHAFKNISDSLSRYFRNKASAQLEKLFQSVEYVKYPPLSHLLPHLVQKLGYNVNVIITYRSFEDFAMSMMIKESHNLVDLKKQYVELNESAIVLLNIYRGCAISYDEVTDKDENDWIGNVSTLCKLDAAKITSIRNESIKKISKINAFELNDPECDRIYKILTSFKGQLISKDSTKINKM